MKYPKWATPQRRGHLAMLMLATTQLPELCEVDVFTGDIFCPEYEEREQELVCYWITDDREERIALWQREQWLMHRDQRRVTQGRFDTTAREIFLAAQPVYYPEAITWCPWRQKRLAKVRVPSSRMRLWVELPSKNALRKARRYGKGDAKSVDETIAQAVRHYLSTL